MLARPPENQTAMLTGAAGGIGRAIARSLLAGGYSVLGVDIDAKVIDHPGGVGSSLGGSYAGMVADTTDHDAMCRVVAVAGLRLRHVVTCAGIAFPDEHEDGGRGLPSASVFRESVDLNLTGHYVATEAAWESLCAGEGNRSVTFISSINALQGFGLVGYSAAKAGLLGLAHALVVPLGAAGIRVNVVAPGTVPTPATRAEWAHVPDHFHRMGADIPMGRLGEPEDVAAAVLSLVRDLRHVSGQTIVVDGGQSLANGLRQASVPRRATDLRVDG